ncbi:hypothetical protein Tco_0922667 [Tanacetum coccineum]|uniref:Retrovirus-related Pol polyprotein from transposon TNT 1-94-like beta-barrel domain-containing protein n=1 Tax=Tanacetum coccineum TaxID=301880 RepID=A0ABQ5D237_9ASTR
MAIYLFKLINSSDNKALESLESRILGHEKNELVWGEKYEFQNYELKCKEIKINNLNMELEKVVKERYELKDKIAKWEESSKNLDEILNSQMSARDKTGLGYSTQLNELSSNHETDSENSFSVFDGRSSDEESTLANDRSSKADGYKAVPPPITGNFLTPRADISFVGKTNDANTEKPKSVNKSVVSNPKINRDSVIIEDWNSNDEEEGTDHFIKDCNFHDKKSQEPKLKNVVNTSQREGKPVWDNTKRVNHQNFSKYPHLSKTFVPSGVLTRTGFVSTARPVCTGRPSISTARTVSTARPSINTARRYASRPIYLRMGQSFRPKDLKQDVKTFGVKNMTTAGKRVVVNTGKGKLDSDLKKSRWVWRPKGNYQDHVSKYSGSFMLMKVEYVDPKGISMSARSEDHAVVDSGCSSHMIGNKAYLSDYQDFNGGFVAFGSDPKGGKITGKGKIKTANLDFDDVYFVDELKNLVPDWMFDLDFSTIQRNYIPVSTENQVNVDAGTQDSYVTGSSGKDKEPTQEYILLPLQPHRTRIPLKDVVQVAQEKLSENASPDKDIQDSKDVIDKEGQHQMNKSCMMNLRRWLLRN